MISIKSALTIAFLLVEITSYVEIAQAQFSPILQANSKQQKPPVPGRPPERDPAGTRGPCGETNTPFTPLLPISKFGFSGFTLSEHPTFWFYIPYETNRVSSGKFSLEDAKGNAVYRTAFKLPSSPGFVSVSIPPTSKSLETNKEYRWTFSLSCVSEDSWETPKVWHTGTVQKVDRPALATQAKTALLEERINLYIKNNIWYDASTDLAKIKTVPKTWLRLMKAMGLEQLDREAIAGSVVPIEGGN